jgi:two-component system heavy metal sensor histidine kinase CusS
MSDPNLSSSFTRDACVARPAAIAHHDDDIEPATQASRLNESSMRRPRSLAAKLTLWYVLSTFILLSLTAALLYGALRRSLSLEDDLFMAHLTTVVRDLLEQHPEDADTVKWEIESEWAARDVTRVYIRLVDPEGRVTAQTPGMAEMLPPAMFPLPVPVTSKPGAGDEVRSPRGRPFRIMAASATTRAGGSRIVQVGLDQTLEKAQLDRYLRGAWAALALGTALAGLLGYVLARKSIQPVQQITDAARRVRSTTLHERIPAAGLPAELWALAAQFNEMLDRLEDAFGRLSQFSADIAHELRTPVNNLRGEAEVALSKARTPAEYRSALESSLEESDRLSRTIEALLFLARAENPHTQVRRERVDVRQELERAREFYEPVAAEKGVAIHLEMYKACPEPDSVSSGRDAAACEPSSKIRECDALVDRTLLQRALYNLIDNALRHTDAGGEVALSVTRDNATVAVAVRDTGCGIPPEHLSRVFDRFYRADRSRTAGTGVGSGLGLSIVQSIVRLHGGAARITSPPAGGTRVELTFPVARHATTPP